MAGAIRYITNKPDVNAFSAGIDFNGGHIDGRSEQLDLRGFHQSARSSTACSDYGLSAFSDSHGGFINNQLTTRTWVNTAVSDNSAWAGKDYNRAHVEGGRVALKGVLNDDWSATLTYSYQRQSTRGAWDQDPNLAPADGRALRARGPPLRSQDARFSRGRRRRHRRSGVREHLLVAAHAPAERVLAVHREL